MKLKNVKPNKMADNVMHLYGLNAFAQVNICIVVAIIINLPFADDTSIWTINS